jgi:argininosuccinate lyase
MPQKRNPVALEHTRILASRAMGQAQAVLTAAHNTPFGDINDSEDDLQPLIFGAFGDAVRALRLYAGAAASIRVNREMLRNRAGRDFLTVTELADTLVRQAGLPFREAHQLVAEAVKASGGSDDCMVDRLLTIRPDLVPLAGELERALDPEHFVRIRTIPGGPAPETVRAQIDRGRELNKAGAAWLAAKRSLLAQCREQHRSSVLY